MASMMSREYSTLAPVGPPRVQEAPFVPTIPPIAGNPALAAMMASLDCELASDGLLVMWHEHEQPPRALFMSGTCQLQSDNERAMIMAAGAAVEADSRSESSRWILADHETEGATLSTRIVVSTGTAVIVSLYRRSVGSLRFRTREAANRYLPMIRSFLQMWADREAIASRLRGASAALDRSAVATILLDQRGSVTFASAAARNMIARKDGVRHGGRMLSASLLPDTLRLQAAIEHVINADGDNPGANSTLVVALHRSDGRPILAAISSVDTTVGSDAAAVVTLYDPSQSTEQMLMPVCKMYGLTPVETKLACLMATGASLVECAAKMHLQEQTARSYVKQLFLKTDTNRQAELVSLLLSSAVRLAPGLKTTFI